MFKKFSLYLTLVFILSLGIPTLFMSSNQFASISETPEVYALKTETVQELRVLFVGDMLFDRYIRKMINQSGEDFIFSCVDDLLKSVDFAVGNLEGPITEHQSISLGSKIGSPSNYVFTFPPETAHTLARNNFKLVNIGNNHISNFGPSGIESTKEFLKNGDIGFFGGMAGDEPIYKVDINGLNLSFISYNEFGGGSPVEVSKKIEEEKQSGRIAIVYTHWGDEYSHEISRIRNIAKTFALAGADIIIGSHPHIVLPSEKMGDTTVYYSLGNFIFDQYFNEEVSSGLAVEAIISKDGISFKEHPVRLEKNGRTCLES